MIVKKHFESRYDADGGTDVEVKLFPWEEIDPGLQGKIRQVCGLR